MIELKTNLVQVFSIMSTHHLVRAAFVLLCCMVVPSAADDTIKLRPSGTLKGTISGMTATEVSIDMAAGKKKPVPVNEIDGIAYDGEPPEIKLARSEMANGNFDAALKSLDKIDAAKVTRSEIQQDLQFYKAVAHARLALEGSGDVRDAGREMLTFAKEHPTNYHYLAAAEYLGHLFAAADIPDQALAQYTVVERAPWPEYKLRAGVAKGRILVAQKKYPEALAAFDAVLKLAGGDAEGPAANEKLNAQLGRATCLAATGDADNAIKIVQEVIDKANPEDVEINARAYVALGNCYRQKPGAVKDARDAFLHVELLYPSSREAHAEALANLARLWNELGKPERALEATQTLKNRYANTPWGK
jgi:tetratricopeptide (TPR) repeat protein